MFSWKPKHVQSNPKQIDIIAERMFGKNRLRVMSAYFQETERAFG